MIMGITLLYYGRNLNVADGFPWFDAIRILEIAYSVHGSLFTIPFIYAAFVFGWREAIIVWSISLSIISFKIFNLSFGPAPLVRNILSSLIPLSVVIFLTLEQNRRKKERESLKKREDERRLYLGQVIKAQEDERHRIAQELHDDFLQSLIVIANRAHKLMLNNGRGSATHAEQVCYIRDEALRLSEDLRRLSRDLRPSILDNRGLVSALRELAARFNQEYGIHTNVITDSLSSKINPEAEVMLFRIIQEALNNVRRHAEATEVTISVKCLSKHLKLIVKDNGKGFDIPKPISRFTIEGKLGIAGMRERAKYLGGNISITSQKGKYTILEVTCPK